MNRVIPIRINNKIATIANRETYYVCGNSDFKIMFEFDDDWEQGVKTARFSYEGKYQDVVFEGNECPIPIIVGTKYIDVGVFVGDLLSSTPARVRAKESIVDGGLPEEPFPDVYAQIIGLCQQAVDTANSVRADADSGKFNGEPGVTDVYTRVEEDEKHEKLQNQIDTKSDKTTVSYLGILDRDISLISCNNADIRYHSTPDAINFILADGEYDWLFTVGISFKTYATPPQISYTNSGLIQWVGTDCSLDNGISLFIPSPDTQYDIVIYFNGSHFVGLVNGYKTATGNVVRE